MISIVEVAIIILFSPISAFVYLLVISQWERLDSITSGLGTNFNTKVTIVNNGQGRRVFCLDFNAIL